ncbi:hypothetical protein PhCBS80983_g03908 [Powellomyces hirtus]|uniref:Solute carrier family 40 member n=1 Tax=Powellomyces hirtus TaxID=109895 RepID=A0A507E0M4_9FUNG|nr:hypothetical protein PhCBS80983_g03908 [Powellomyces hirtus]
MQSPTEEEPVARDQTENAGIAPSEISPDKFDIRTGHILCVSYLFTTWSVRADEWATAIFLAYIFPHSLLQVSLYTLIVTLSAILFSGTVGGIVDRSRRLVGIRVFLIIQKAAIATSAFLLFVTSEWLRAHDAWTYIGFSGVCSTGILLRLANIGTTISVEKDWVVVLAAGKSDFLTSLNTHLRRIDLTCKVAAPLAVSLIGISLSTPVVMLVVAAMSLITIPIEWMFMSAVYRRHPALAVSKERHDLDLSNDSLATSDRAPIGDRESPLSPTQSPGGPDQRRSALHLPAYIVQKLRKDCRNWQKFFHHEVFLSSLAVAQLYMTVLAFGPVMITYLILQGYSATFLAGMRFLAVFAGLASTFAIPRMVRKIGLVRTGLWAVWCQFASLVPAAAAFWVMEDKVTAGILLFSGTILSRFGLWMFDLAQTQIMQERVDIAESGLINGMQSSLQNVFDLGASAATIIWSNPSDFYIPACLSVGLVFSSALTFTVYALKNRGHLFHFDKLAKWDVHKIMERGRNRFVTSEPAT